MTRRRAARSAAPALCCLLLAGLVAPLAGQDAPEPRPGAAFVGATLGSGAGLLLWTQYADSYGSYGGALGGLFAFTTVGSALGAWVFTQGTSRPGFGAFLGASMVGALAGSMMSFAAATVTYGEGSLGPVVLTYTLSQGTLTSLLVSRTRPSGRP